jgi:NDP-sugar pyrophosphorylase family protein/aminoglycoside/choline kinase family phosphotransferase
MKSPPRKAFILAAGFGTRLLPLTRVVPKPLLPLGGIPMLDRAIALVKSWGVNQVVVNVHHGANAMVNHLTHRKPDGLHIQISFEPEILGTGGALAKASWFFADNEPFWMINADVAADVNYQPVLKAYRPGKTIASAWLMSTRGPRTVESHNGLITNFQSKRPGTEGTFTFCGVHLVDPGILKYLPPGGFSSIIDGYQKAMADGWHVAGVPVEKACWADIGTPAQYVQAEKEIVSAADRRDVGPYHNARKRPVGTDVPSVRDQVSIKDKFIYGPRVPRKTYSGIMAMRAVDALGETEQALLRKWKKQIDAVVACPLSPRGSARTFTRLYAGPATAMLVQHKPEREENNLYVSHTKFLAALGIPVPRVLADDPENHLALFEDVGITSVQDEAPKWNGKKLEQCYRKVLDKLIVFHEEGGRVAKRKRIKLMPPFDAKLYTWEHDLFANLFLKERAGFDDARIVAVKKELAGISSVLSKNKSVLLHRDFQSSNILLKKGKWYVIDYQGMRMGPAVYDLASMLCDPYISMDPNVRDRLLAYYAAKADKQSRCHETFWLAVIQRLGQALGAYARLSKISGMSHFSRYIRPALRNMHEALAHIHGGYPALRDAVAECLTKDENQSA